MLVKCVELYCPGEVNMEKIISVQIDCRSTDAAFACRSCGRLHWKDGRGILNRSGERAFRDPATGRQFLRGPEPAKSFSAG